MEVFTFNHEFVTGLNKNYNLEEGIFLRELYAIMYKQVEIGRFFALSCIILPLCGQASIVPAPLIKENDSKSPSDKGNGKAVHAVLSCPRLCYGHGGYGKTKGEKEKANGKGRSDKKEKE